MYKKELLFLLFAYLLNGVAFSQPAQVIIADKFINNNTKWWVGENKDITCKISNDKLIINHKNPAYSWLSIVNSDLYEKNDFFIECKINPISVSKSKGYGIVWGHSRKGYYAFAVRPDGKFFVRMVSGRKAKYLVRPKKIKFRGGEIISLRVQRDRRSYVFFIDGRFVAKIPFKHFFGQNAGIIIYGLGKIAVDEFGIYGTRLSEIVNNQPPKPTISVIAINDRNKTSKGNQRIEAGETIDVTAFVKNEGTGKCKNTRVKITLLTADPNITFPDNGKIKQIGNIKNEEVKKIKFYFYTSAKFKQPYVEFLIKFICINHTSTQTIRLFTNKIYPKPESVQLESNKKTGRGQNTIVRFEQLSDVDVNIPKTNYNGNHTIAVIIGISDYKYCPECSYADRDAIAFYNFAVKYFNIPKQNIYLLLNNDATLGEFYKLFSDNGILRKKIVYGKTNLILFYAGHGVPAGGAKTPYLLPYDIDPKYPASGYSLNTLIKSIERFNPASALMFFDANFAGLGRNGEKLIPEAGTIWKKPVFPTISKNNFYMYLASGSELPNVVNKKEKHGAFTYYLLKGLKTRINNASGEISAINLYQFIKQNVSDYALDLNKLENVRLIYDKKDMVIIK